MKIPSWAYEVFFERLTKVSSFFLCQFSEIFSAFLASFRFSRNFLCATVTHVVSHSFSLIQNRTVDYCARIAHLGRKALHPPTQSFASAHAKLCIRQRKALPSFRSPIPMFFPLSLICFSVTIVLGIKNRFSPECILFIPHSGKNRRVS